MYKKTFYEGVVLNEKGALDHYDPPKFTSNNYKNWIANLDFRICSICKALHGKIYSQSENPIPYPPLHQKCRCIIKPVTAVRVGDATKDGQNGADWYLRNYGTLPNYYIDDIGLKNSDGKAVINLLNTLLEKCSQKAYMIIQTVICQLNRDVYGTKQILTIVREKEINTESFGLMTDLCSLLMIII